MNEPVMETAVSEPKRANGERTLVRAVIAVMLTVVAIEAYSAWRMNLVVEKLRTELGKNDQIDSPISKQDVTKIVGGREPDASFPVKAAAGEELYDVYYFSGLLGRRTLYVHYSVMGAAGGDRDLMEVMTEIPPEVQAVKKS